MYPEINVSDLQSLGVAPLLQVVLPLHVDGRAPDELLRQLGQVARLETRGQSFIC